jgi:hypothetical protein
MDMTHMQALELLYNIVSQVPLTADQHNAARIAASKLAALVQESEQRAAQIPLKLDD